LVLLTKVVSPIFNKFFAASTTCIEPPPKPPKPVEGYNGVVGH
jgi:hypothetical protein